MTQALTWRGQRGAVLLGPTEHRVASYLADATRYGRVKLRTVAIAERCGLARSEAYRIVRRLQALGLFGVADDRSGARGGRLLWRTSSRRPGAELDPTRHRHAWARLVAAARARTAAILQRVRNGKASTARQRLVEPPAPMAGPVPGARLGVGAGAGPPSFAAAIRQHAPALAAAWDADPRQAPRRWESHR